GNHRKRHVTTMAIGVGGALTIHYYMIRLQPSALLLLCSDGLHGVVEPPVIENILRDNGTGHEQLEYKCKSLVEAAKEAAVPDNAARCHSPHTPTSPAPSPPN